jgi:hypothetical protein
MSYYPADRPLTPSEARDIRIGELAELQQEAALDRNGARVRLYEKMIKKLEAQAMSVSPPCLADNREPELAPAFVTARVGFGTFEVLDVTDDDKLVIAVAAWTAEVDPADYRLATEAEIAEMGKVVSITARLRERANPDHTVGR